MIFEGVPSREIAKGRYIVRFAKNELEVEAALKLRFKVFNLELGEGLQSSYQSEKDVDLFDQYCHHLLILESNSGDVVGTYRMQTFEMAQSGKGFYSEGEFDLENMPIEVLKESVEVGRACIAKEHRNTGMLFLLWQGLAMYMSHTQNRYLFGCSSITSQSCEEGQSYYEFIKKSGFLHDSILVQPLPDFDCGLSNGEKMKELPSTLPRLFRTYLNYGGKVCSPPAIDREFKTIDFLLLLDVDAFDEATYKMFFR